MAVNFSAERWDAVKDMYRTWWAGASERPMLHLIVKGPGSAPEPELPHHHRLPFYDRSVCAEDIIGRMDYELSRQTYLGSAFPSWAPDFGPGVIAALLGCRLENGENTVWFHPEQQREITDLWFEPADNGYWFGRISDMMRAAMDRWQGMVQVGMTDLGGNLDILSSFRPGERLLFDLYDHPDEVKRLTDEAHAAWWHYFETFDRLLRPQNPGYTAWMPIFSETPAYMLQCDFCYMISPAMFDEFVKPELTRSCAKLDNAFYHLDGPGELPHLDSLLEIEDLKGVQWIPGTGQKRAAEWMDVLHTIERAGKNVQFFGGLDEIDAVLTQAENPGRYYAVLEVDEKQRSAAEELLTKWGYPVGAGEKAVCSV